jgi:hypothetical protein
MLEQPDKDALKNALLVKARAMMADAVLVIQKFTLNEFPRLSAQTINAILEDELAKFMFAALNDRSRLTQEDSNAVIERIVKRCGEQQEST